MTPAHVVTIVTPKKIVLNGLWFGPKRAKRVIVWVHGLSGSVFSNGRYLRRIIDKETAVLTFNNRGHDIISGIRFANGTFGRYGGEVHEVFKDSFDDIEGAVRFTRKTGAKYIFVGGSSTGSQKTAYWASRTKNFRNVRGLIFSVPLSDHASAAHSQGRAKLLRALSTARRMVQRGKNAQLLPTGLWHQPFDAQRFLTLYSGKGIEEIFTYWDKRQNPRTLHSIKQPILVLLAGADEYADRPAAKIGDWFAEHLKVGDEVAIIPRVGHSFRGGEKKVAATIRAFMKR